MKLSKKTFFKKTEEYIFNHKKYVFGTAINLTILFLISLILQITGTFEIQRFIDIELFMWVTIVFDTIVIRLYHYATKSNIAKSFFEYGFVTLLILQSIKGMFDIKILDIFNNNLLFLAIIFGTVILYDTLNTTDKTKKMTKEESTSKYIFNKIDKEKAYTYSIILIFILFAIIKFSVPYFYTGSYIDEYKHIFAGIELFENGNPIEAYKNLDYTRGAYVSFLVGLVMLIFGQNIYVANMVPATIGIISFILLYSIAKKMIKRKEYILLTMSIYTISPWFIFNHFYIRHYVFYEFFLLASVYLFFRLTESISDNNIKKILINLTALISINLINYFLSNDLGQYIIIVANLILFCYIFLFEIHKIELPKSNIFFKQINKILKLKFSAKILILAYIVVASFIVIDVSDKVHRLTVGVIAFTNPEQYKYDNLFFNLNPTFTAFFILSSILLLKNKINKHTAVIFLSIALFSAHMISSGSLQVTRVIIYFLPLFYLVSILMLSKFKFNKFITIMVISLLLINVYSNYSDDFIDEPHIPREVNYVEYQNIYLFVKDNCNDSLKINFLHAPYISKFYGAETDYISIIRPTILANYGAYYDSNSSKYYTSSKKDTEILTSMNELKKIHNSPDKKCYILPTENKHIWRYITSEFANQIRNNNTFKKQVKDIEIIVIQ